MAKKSIWNQISNPRDKYIDGYGVSRPVYEPGYITVGRKIYNGVDEFLNGLDNINGMPINKGAGALEFFFDPAGAVGKVDDVAMLVKNLDSAKDKWDGLRRFQLRRKVNGTPAAQKSLERKFSKTAEEELAEEFLDLPYNAWYTEEDVLNRIRNRVSGRVQGNSLNKRKLELDRPLNPLAQQYNELLKAGKSDEAAKVKQKMVEILENYESPWWNGSYYDINTRIFDSKNGGPGLTTKEQQTLLLDEEFPW